MNRKQFRQLLIRSQAMVALFTFVLVLGGGLGITFYSLSSEDDSKMLRMHWDHGTLQCRPTSNRPIVITHLVHYDYTGESKKIVATLPEPLAIVDASSARIDEGTLKRLVWHFAIGDKRGKQASPPIPGTPVEAIYYYPMLSRQSTISSK